MEKRTFFPFFLLLTVVAVSVRSSNANDEDDEITVFLDELAMEMEADEMAELEAEYQSRLVSPNEIEDDIAPFEENTALEDGAEKDVADLSDEASLFLHGSCRCDRHWTQTGLCYVGVDNDTMNTEMDEFGYLPGMDGEGHIYGRNDCEEGYVPTCGKIVFICYCLCKPELTPLRPDVNETVTSETEDKEMTEKPLRPDGLEDYVEHLNELWLGSLLPVAMTDKPLRPDEDTDDNATIEEKIEELQNKVEELENKVEKLEKAVKEDQQDLQDLEDDVEQDIEDLHNEVEHDIEELHDEVEHDIQELEEDVEENLEVIEDIHDEVEHHHDHE